MGGDNVTAWIVPLTFLPGVAALILSTTQRFFHINGLIREFIAKGDTQTQAEVAILLHRSRRFHDALFCLYLSVTLFSVAALVSNFHLNWYQGELAILAIADSMTVAGVFCVVIASVVLVRETWRMHRRVVVELDAAVAASMRPGNPSGRSGQA